MYQLPALANEYVFEDFICDLFNKMHNTESFQNFGVKGQLQKGIDVLGSVDKGIVLQCKKKDINAKENKDIADQLILDLNIDLKKANGLTFDIKRYILVSTFRDDSRVQEEAALLSQQKNIQIEYWGWNTLTKHVFNHPSILNMYFPEYKKDEKMNIFTLNIWENEGKYGFDLSQLLHSIEGSISSIVKDDLNENDKTLYSVLKQLSDLFGDAYSETPKMTFDNFGFNTYLKASFEQSIESFDLILKEKEYMYTNTEQLNDLLKHSLNDIRSSLDKNDYFLVFKPKEHPAVKFIKNITLNFLEDFNYDKADIEAFLNNFNNNIETKIVNCFGINEYSRHLDEVKTKWLKENEINFLIKMTRLSQIGFSKNELLKYQKSYGKWEDVKNFNNYNTMNSRTLESISKNDNDEIRKEDSLKEINYLIDEYYEYLQKSNIKLERDHTFDSILFIIADFGKGKSSFIKHYASELANNYLKKAEGEFPVYFNLNEFKKYSAPHKHGVIGNYLETEHSIKLDDTYYKKKRFIFLIDSLDESGELTERNIDEVIGNIKLIHNIDKLLCRTNKIIVTSRPFDQGLKNHLIQHSPFEYENKDKLPVAQYISIYGFKKEQFNDYVQDALMKYWKNNENENIILTGLSKTINENIKSNTLTDIFDIFRSQKILTLSELRRPIFAYMIYNLLANNIDSTGIGKIGIYLSFINKLSKDAKYRDDEKYEVNLQEEFKFRNLLHSTAILWQYKRQAGDQNILKKADLCRVLTKMEKNITDEDVLKNNPEIEAIQFLSHSYLGDNENNLHFHHQSFAEMLLAEYYLKVFIKFGIELNPDIEEAKKSLMLGIPTDQTIEFLKGLLELLISCCSHEVTEELIEKRKLLAPLLSSLATKEYSKNLLSDRLYHQWFEDILNEIEDTKYKYIPEKFLEKWPLKEKELKSIGELAKKIIESDTNYLFTRGESQTILISNEIVQTDEPVNKIPHNMEKWLALLVGNVLCTDEETIVFFNEGISKPGIFFELIRNWNYSFSQSAPIWGRSLFKGINMIDNENEISIMHTNLELLDFSNSYLSGLTFSFCNIDYTNFENVFFNEVNVRYCHLHQLNFRNVSVNELEFIDCIYVSRDTQYTTFNIFNLSTIYTVNQFEKLKTTMIQDSYKIVINEIFETFYGLFTLNEFGRTIDEKLIVLNLHSKVHEKFLRKLLEQNISFDEDDIEFDDFEEASNQ